MHDLMEFRDGLPEFPFQTDPNDYFFSKNFVAVTAVFVISSDTLPAYLKMKLIGFSELGLTAEEEMHLIHLLKLSYPWLQKENSGVLLSAMILELRHNWIRYLDFNTVKKKGFIKRLFSWFLK